MTQRKWILLCTIGLALSGCAANDHVAPAAGTWQVHGNAAAAVPKG